MRIVAVLLSLLLLAGCASPALAPEAEPEQEPDPALPTLVIDGHAVTGGLRLINGVPAASANWLADALGWDYDFANDAQRGRLTSADRVLQFELDERYFDVNGHRQSWDMVLPHKLDGEVYVNAVLTVSPMGYRAAWDEAAMTLTVERMQANEIVIHTETIEADSPHVSVAVQYPRFEGFADAAAEARINALFAEHGALTLARAEDFAEEYDDPAGMRYTFDLSYETTQNETNIVSVVLHDYSFAGGAHGWTIRYSYTFDVVTGHEYTLNELFGHVPDWPAPANALIAAGLEEMVGPDYSNFETMADDQPFYIWDGRAIVYFQQYEYTPYALGFPEFELPWEPDFGGR